MKRTHPARLWLMCGPFIFGSITAHAGVNEGAYEVLENGAGKFKIDIQNCPVACANVESVTIDDITIDVVDLTEKGSDLRVFGPGDAHYGSITIRARMGGSTELFDWWQASTEGEFIRRDITITIFDKKDQPARRFQIFDAFPTRWDPGEYSPSSLAGCETIVAKMGRVELASTGPGDDDPERPGRNPRRGRRANPGGGRPDALLGFTVTIDGEEPRQTSGRPDTAWEACLGGSLNIEVADSSTGSDQTHTTTPGHKYVDEVTLKGPLTGGRKDLTNWITEVVQGKDWKRSLTVTEITTDGSDGKVYTYHDCFPTRYVFPALASSGTGNLYEEVSIKPIRLELK